MRRISPVLAAFLLSACNVFFPLRSVAPDEGTTNPTTNGSTNGTTPVACSSGCTCDLDCTASCSQSCTVKCEGISICDGEVAGDSTVICEGDSECMMACTGTGCDVTCADRGTRCEPDCAAGTACILRCGQDRNDAQRSKCVFQTCPVAVEDCGAGVFACNTPCP